MTVLLQNRETHLYYAGTNQWTDNPDGAVDFGSVELAIHAFKLERVSFAEIVTGDGPRSGKTPLLLPDEKVPLTDWFSAA